MILVWESSYRKCINKACIPVDRTRRTSRINKESSEEQDSDSSSEIHSSKQSRGSQQRDQEEVKV